VEKKLAQTVEQVQRQHPEATVEQECEDEHRVGLHPVNRMVWVPRGEQPVAKVNWKFEWLWLVGFVHPHSGETKGVDCATA
jgi:hypothetical protein